MTKTQTTDASYVADKVAADLQYQLFQRAEAQRLSHALNSVFPRHGWRMKKHDTFPHRFVVRRKDEVAST